MVVVHYVLILVLLRPTNGSYYRTTTSICVIYQNAGTCSTPATGWDGNEYTDCDCDTIVASPTPTPTISVTPSITSATSWKSGQFTPCCDGLGLPDIFRLIPDLTTSVGDTIVVNGVCYEFVQLFGSATVYAVPSTDKCAACISTHPCPTPSPSPTPSVTQTPSKTPTTSVTQTPSQTPTTSVTQTPSQTPTTSVTQTPSPTPTTSIPYDSWIAEPCCGGSSQAFNINDNLSPSVGA